MPELNKDLRSYFGDDFEKKVVHILMLDHQYFEKMEKAIDQNMFGDPKLKVWIGQMKMYYGKYNTVPSYSIMGTILHQFAHSDIERAEYADLVKELSTQTSDGIGYIEEMSTKFFKMKYIIRASKEMQDIAIKGDLEDLDKIQEIFTKAAGIGQKDYEGVSAGSDIESALDEDYRSPILTGIKGIDECLEGGVGRGELMVLIGSSSFGKVQPNDAKIVTPNGYKYMGEIKVGDYVIGKNGKPTKVIGVFPHKNWEFYKVTFSDGVSTECGKEHLWNVNTRYQRVDKKCGYDENGVSKKTYKPDYSYKTMSLAEIMESGLYRGRKGTTHNFQIPMCEPVYFEEIPVKIDPYVMGYMIGDGNFQRCSISISKEDKESLLENLDKSKHKYVYHNRPKNNHRDTISMVGSFRHLLQEYYDLSSVSKDTYIHKDYLYNSKENRVALLNGLMDSDGTCKKNGCSCYNTKSKRLAEDVKQLVLSLGGFANVREKKTGYFSKKYEKYINCGIQYEVTITLCDPSINIFRLKRKQDMVAYRTLRKNGRFFQSVEFSRVCDGQCIKVDAKDELYLTDDFIVTHNTSMTTGIAYNAATHLCPDNNNKGYKVLQIVFEDLVKNIQRKLVGRETGYEAKDVSKSHIKPDVINKLATSETWPYASENIVILRLPSGEKTAWDIEREIKKQMNLGFNPDLVIVDYFECLDHPKNSSLDKWELEGKTMRKFESMAHEMNKAFIIPLQGTKDSVTSDIVTMDKAGGSFKKIQIAHIVMSIARSQEDIEYNKATLSILKNRSGGAGKIFEGAYFNNGTCIVNTDENQGMTSIFGYGKKQEEATQSVQSRIMQEIAMNNNSKQIFP